MANKNDKPNKSNDQQMAAESVKVTHEDSRDQVRGLLTATENAIPKFYREQYDRIPEEIKKRCDWETISKRLLADGGEKLKKAEAMQGGGELVGIDAEGKAMFKDRGVEPVIYGFGGRGLMRIYNRNPMQMCEVHKWANYFEIREQVLREGYELFADEGMHRYYDIYKLSGEIGQVQNNTNEFFVASKDGVHFRASWLESGDRPVNASIVVSDPYFYEDDQTIVITNRPPEDRHSSIGVARLLRV